MQTEVKPGRKFLTADLKASEKELNRLYMQMDSARRMKMWKEYNVIGGEINALNAKIELLNAMLEDNQS